MEKHFNNKREYKIPIINQIQLDNEISLTMESTPPTYESLNRTKVLECFNNTPFDT